MKVICRLVLIVLCASLFVGCTAEPKPPEPITLRVMVKNKFTFSYANVIKSKFPHIDFEIIDAEQAYVYQPGDSFDDNDEYFKRKKERVIALIQEKQPDIFLDIPFDDLPNDQPLVDLEPMIRRDQYELSEIQKNLVERDRASFGYITSISPTFEREILFVNSKLFQDYSVEEPIGAIDWPEFRRIAQQFQSEDEVYGYHLQGSENWNIVAQVANEMIGLDYYANEQINLFADTRWAELFKDLIYDYKNGVLHINDKDFNIQKMRKIAMFTGGYDLFVKLLGSGEQAENWSFIAMPTDSQNPFLTPFEATNKYAINSSSQHIEESWEVIKYINSKEAAPFIAKSLMPARMMTHFEHTPSGNFNIDAFFEAAAEPVSINRPGKQIYIGNSLSTFWTILDSELNSVTQDEKTFEEAWNQIEEQSKVILEKCEEIGSTVGGCT